MKRSARLTLKKETLADLTGADLSIVAAASVGPTCYTCTCRSCLDCLIDVAPTLLNTACVPEITFRTICR